MPPLEMVVFVLAVVATMAYRVLAGPAPPRGSLGRRRGRVTVLLHVHARDDWNALLWQCVHAATAPEDVHFGVAVGCATLADTASDVDTVLRSRVVVHHARERSLDVDERAVARLARRFVRGDEALVVVLDARASLLPGWDAALLACRGRLGDDGVASSPAFLVDHAAGFPCLDATGRRADARPFAKAADAGAQPSVAWCSEVTAARPAAFRAWPRVTHLVPTRPVLAHDPALRVARAPIGRDPTRAERVGLTPRFTEAEALAKYGSVAAARLAVRLR